MCSCTFYLTFLRAGICVYNTDMKDERHERRKIEQIIREYAKEAKMMQLATAKDGRPWVCNVWFATDDNLNFYWFSAMTRRHSQEVQANPYVAASVCLPQTPSDAAIALQIEGRAEELVKPGDTAQAMKCYVGRVFNLKQVKEFMKHPTKPHRFYRLTPKSIILFDTVHFPNESRQEFHLR